MAVSTFSQHSRSSSTRSHRSSRLISRCNDTRDRIDPDERRRRSMRETQDLDGIGLYDRPDWPLSSPTPPIFQDDDDDDDQAEVDQEPEVRSRDHVRKSILRKGPREIGNELARDGSGGLGGPPNGTGYMDEHDVSDLEEDDDDENVGQHRGSIFAGQPSPHIEEQEHHHEIPADLRRSSYRSFISPPRDAHPEVSPVREEYASPSSRDERQPLHVLISDHTQQREVSPLVHAGTNGAEVEDDDDDNNNNNELYESQDIATPIVPFSGNSPVQPYQPQVLGTPTTSPPLRTGSFTQTSPLINGASNRSSISSAPMHSPPDRRKSIRNRSSWINTSNNKSHVRYSWQSIQENDKPNKPRIHIIKLVSNTATASAGFPTGEAFGFSISPGGRKIAAYNSARLYVLQTNALPVGISQDYALKRRPLAVELTDEGNTMAILADDHTVNIYDIGLHLKRVRTIKLDFPTNCIALAPTGGLLAAAYEGGVEIFSLAASALPTDRRAVRSVKMDRLTFSEDGSTLLGTTTRINVSATVVVNVPVFPSEPGGVPTHEELKEAWCSELLHPENIRNSSHAVFMHEGRKTCNERLFAWNGLEDTFGILNVSDMKYGKIDFPVVISPPLSTCGGLGAAIHSCPSIDEHGDTMAMVVNDRTIRLYIYPQLIDDDAPTVEAHSIDHELDEGYGCPFSEARWVYSASSLPAPLSNQNPVKGRLIVTSPGGVLDPTAGEESVEDIEGGRIIIFDFDPQFAGQPGQTFNLTLGKSPPQTLEEEEEDLEQQVAIVRRRTVNQSKGKGLSTRPASLGRAATTTGPRNQRNAGAAQASSSRTAAPGSRASMLSIGSMQSDAARSLPDLMENGEQADVFDEPYVQGAPRSQASLQRAASNVQRHRFQTLEERQRERISVDSHGDFLALPEYTEEPNAPLPSRYRAMAGLDQPSLFTPGKSAVVVNANGALASPSGSSSTTSPRTAPPNVGENFNADLAFRAATTQQAQTQAQAQIQPQPQPPAPMPAQIQTAPPAQIREAVPEPPIQERLIERPIRSSIVQSPLPSPASVPRAGTAMSTSPGDQSSQRGSYFRPPSVNNNRDSINSAYGTNTFTAQPLGRNGTFDSIASMPRGLQRAYSNAISPLGGPPPGVMGNWRNVSPINGTTSPLSHSRQGSIPNGHISPASVPEEEAWDTISPTVPTRRSFSPYGQQPGFSYRHSTSFINPPGHPPPPRAASASSFYGPTTTAHSPPYSANGMGLPPHMQAFRTDSATNSSASLFPPSQPRDHVPLRQNTVKASSVAHPVTAWHPPAAASTPALTRTSGSMRGSHHSRKSSVAGRSAFPSTAKAKKLGFFKRSRRQHDPYGPSAYNGGAEGGSVLETKSVMTWMTKSDNKCVVM